MCRGVLLTSSTRLLVLSADPMNCLASKPIVAISTTLWILSLLSAQTFSVLHPFGGFPEGRSPQASLVAAGNSFFSVSDSGGTGHSGLFETLIVGFRGRARPKLLRGSENQSARSIVKLGGRNCVTKVCVEAFLTGNLEKRAFHSFHRIATCS